MKENHFGSKDKDDENMKEDMDELKKHSSTEESIISTSTISLPEKVKNIKLVTVNNNDMQKNLHATVSKGLKNIISKNKGKKGIIPKVMSQLDEWMDDGLIVDYKQRDYIESLLL
jgi:protein-arginine kinase